MYPAGRTLRVICITMKHLHLLRKNRVSQSVLRPLASILIGQIVWSRCSEVTGHRRSQGRGRRRKTKRGVATVTSMPPPIQPESILEYVPKASRVLKLEANIIAYFGDLFYAFQQGLSASPVTSARKAPADTASSQNQS